MFSYNFQPGKEESITRLLFIKKGIFFLQISKLDIFTQLFKNNDTPYSATQGGAL